MMLEADGSFLDGWNYVRDIHGGVSNIRPESVATLLGTEVEYDSQGKATSIIVNKGRKNITPTLAIYNHDGNYRFIVKDEPKAEAPKEILGGGVDWNDVSSGL